MRNLLSIAAAFEPVQPHKTVVIFLDLPHRLSALCFISLVRQETLAGSWAMARPHPKTFHRAVWLLLNPPDAYLSIISAPVVIGGCVVLVELCSAPVIEGLVW